jgi:hypothetical protein
VKHNVHLGPQQLASGMWRIVFEVPCTRPASDHGDNVACEPLSPAATDRLKTRLFAAGALGSPPKTWPSALEAVRFVTSEVLKAMGHTA